MRPARSFSHLSVEVFRANIWALAPASFPAHAQHSGRVLHLPGARAEMYSLLLETYIKDSAEKHRLFHAVDTVPAVRRKAQWALKWIGRCAARPAHTRSLAGSARLWQPRGTASQVPCVFVTAAGRFWSLGNDPCCSQVTAGPCSAPRPCAPPAPVFHGAACGHTDLPLWRAHVRQQRQRKARSSCRLAAHAADGGRGGRPASPRSRSGWWRGRAWRASSSRAPSARSSGSRSAA